VVLQSLSWMTRTGKEKEGAEGVLGQEVDWAGLGRLRLKKKGRRRGSWAREEERPREGLAG
jgi:hypothetical protein